jgi:ferredoxin
MPKLTYQHTGQTIEIKAGSNYLDFCQDHKVPQDFGCTVGSCGTCRVEILAGMQNLNPITAEEQETVEMCTDAPNARLGCQLTINGDVTLRPAD